MKIALVGYAAPYPSKFIHLSDTLLTYSLDFRFQVSHVLAFDAPRLQTVNIAEALMRVTKSVVIHSSELPQALEDVLRESSHLGMHTGVVHLSLGNQQDANILNVGKYVTIRKLRTAR